MDKLKRVKTTDGSIYVVKATDANKMSAWIDAKPHNVSGDFSWEIWTESIIAKQKEDD